SAHVGVFGSIIQRTDVEGILQLDLLATDFFRNEAYPSYLYYNPYDEEREVTVSLPSESGEVALYDAVQARFVVHNVAGKAKVKLPPAGAAVLVAVPAGAEIRQEGGKLWAGDVVIDYRFDATAETSPTDNGARR